MHFSEIISLNLWDTLISLCNLVILYIIIKKFLYKPVRKILDKRQAELDEKYQDAENAKQDAMADRDEWEQRMKDVDVTADALLRDAEADADRQSDRIVAEARERAEHIIDEAEKTIELERKKSAEGMKQEIIDISALLAEKMLNREIDIEDHRDLIDSFIDEIGEDDDQDD